MTEIKQVDRGITNDDWRHEARAQQITHPPSLGEWQVTDEENPRAFPRTASPTDALQDGMSLRDWFAGQALAGLMGNSGIVISYGEGYPENNAGTATVAYIMADAMLKERTPDAD